MAFFQCREVKKPQIHWFFDLVSVRAGEYDPGDVRFYDSKIAYLVAPDGAVLQRLDQRTGVELDAWHERIISQFPGLPDVLTPFAAASVDIGQMGAPWARLSGLGLAFGPAFGHNFGSPG